MKRFQIVIGLLLLAAPPLFAFAQDATPSPLRIQSELHTLQARDENGQAKTLRRLIVLLVNTGNQPITVVTDKLDQGRQNTDGVMTITLGLNAMANKDGHLIVPSLSRFAPVTLQPGEAASISTDSIDLSTYKDGKLAIAYRVSDFWGKRLSLWAGTVSCKPGWDYGCGA